MPQMSPLSWMILSISIVILLYNTNSMWFSHTTNKQSPSNINIQHMNMNWRW
uniref:ATP synthase F0 subunit 8 n=1 Tax=Ricinoides karschii TaxID=1238228 RepID=W5R4L3_9ARAC|nr:ATP synthase F0 subunit 8 [Ricinoides karschii]AGL11948.1 ATP synthase F0 subunit 8 [Ricinoides karschii]